MQEQLPRGLCASLPTSGSIATPITELINVVGGSQKSVVYELRYHYLIFRF